MEILMFHGVVQIRTWRCQFALAGLNPNPWVSSPCVAPG